jgi:tetratricopeptide (TPR) repeat protein
VQNDLVLYEALTLLGSGTRLRKYGLVIPEKSVVPDKTEEKLLIFDDIEIKTEEKKEKELDLLGLEADDGPLAEVFRLWDENGLSAGLDKYFELLLDDPGLAAQDDKGLLQKGEEFFKPRFESHKDDEEARYYIGMLYYVNGMFKEAEFTLKPFEEKTGKFASRLEKAFETLKGWRRQEEERIAAIKRAEEERLAAELRAKQEAEEAARNKDVFDEIKKQTEGEAPKTGSVNAEARVFHDKGFDLYKKGRLDEAIIQFEQAIIKDDKDSQTYYHMGLAYTDKGLAGNVDAFDRAITAFKRVVALSPTGKMAKDAESMIRDIEAAKSSLGGGAP